MGIVHRFTGRPAHVVVTTANYLGRQNLSNTLSSSSWMSDIPDRSSNVASIDQILEPYETMGTSIKYS